MYKMLTIKHIHEVAENKKDGCHDNRILSKGKILLLYLDLPNVDNILQKHEYRLKYIKEDDL